MKLFLTAQVGGVLGAHGLTSHPYVADHCMRPVGHQQAWKGADVESILGLDARENPSWDQDAHSGLHSLSAEAGVLPKSSQRHRTQMHLHRMRGKGRAREGGRVGQEGEK